MVPANPGSSFRTGMARLAVIHSYWCSLRTGLGSRTVMHENQSPSARTHIPPTDSQRNRHGSKQRPTGRASANTVQISKDPSPPRGAPRLAGQNGSRFCAFGLASEILSPHSDPYPGPQSSVPFLRSFQLLWNFHPVSTTGLLLFTSTAPAVLRRCPF